MNRWVPILCYHRVCNGEAEQDALRLCTTTERLERVLRHLSDHDYRFVSLEAAIEVLRSGRQPGQRYACLTFDDGYQDLYTNALPLLQKYGATATVFAVTGCIDATNSWDQAGGTCPIPLLSRGQVLELDSMGIEFGSHGVSHRRLTFLGREDREREIRGSKETLEELLGHEVRFFCYPHGDCNEEVREEVGQAGYVGACGIEQEAHEPFLLHRIDVAQANWPSTLLRLSGRRHLLQRSRLLRAARQRILPARQSRIVPAGADQ